MKSSFLKAIAMNGVFLFVLPRLVHNLLGCACNIRGRNKEVILIKRKKWNEG